MSWYNPFSWFNKKKKKAVNYPTSPYKRAPAPVPPYPVDYTSDSSYHRTETKKKESRRDDSSDMLTGAALGYVIGSMNRNEPVAETTKNTYEPETRSYSGGGASVDVDNTPSQESSYTPSSSYSSYDSGSSSSYDSGSSSSYDSGSSSGSSSSGE